MKRLKRRDLIKYLSRSSQEKLKRRDLGKDGKRPDIRKNLTEAA